jgi:UDP-2-acetamido-3-amino-2,3-dideoxy-glucuronate N-acetyltransferase
MERANTMLNQINLNQDFGRSRKVCVVGAGRWGKNHIKTFADLGVLAGVVETNQDALLSLRKQYPDVKLFTNIEHALEHDFDGFTIATPVHTHFDVAKAIIESGRHVLVEKPITMKSTEALELKRLAEQNKVNLMVGHVLLFHPAFRKIKELIDNGILGELQYVYSNRLNLGTIRTEENVFWSFAPHDISLFQYLTDSFPQVIASSGAMIIQDGLHDTTITTIKYPGNVTGHIYVSWLHPFKEHRFVVIGSNGMIRFEDSMEGKPLVFYDKGVVWQAGKPQARDGEVSHIDYDKTPPLTLELKYFVDHLDGTPVEIANAQNAVEVMQILEGATESLMKGQDQTTVKLQKYAS